MRQRPYSLAMRISTADGRDDVGVLTVVDGVLVSLLAVQRPAHDVPAGGEQGCQSQRKGGYYMEARNHL